MCALGGDRAARAIRFALFVGRGLPSVRHFRFFLNGSIGPFVRIMQCGTLSSHFLPPERPRSVRALGTFALADGYEPMGFNTMEPMVSRQKFLGSVAAAALVLPFALPGSAFAAEKGGGGRVNGGAQISGTAGGGGYARMGNASVAHGNASVAHGESSFAAARTGAHNDVRSFGNRQRFAGERTHTTAGYGPYEGNRVDRTRYAGFDRDRYYRDRRFGRSGAFALGVGVGGTVGYPYDYGYPYDSYAYYGGPGYFGPSVGIGFGDSYAYYGGPGYSYAGYGYSPGCTCR
jgi:hypothetical protein